MVMMPMVKGAGTSLEMKDPCTRLFLGALIVRGVVKRTVTSHVQREVTGSNPVRVKAL